MNAAHEETAPTAAAERLMWAEIQRRLPDEWVVLVDTDWANDHDFEFGTALVVGHRKRRKDASAVVKAAFESHQDVGCFWTGEIRVPELRHAHRLQHRDQSGDQIAGERPRRAPHTARTKISSRSTR